MLLALRAWSTARVLGGLPEVSVKTRSNAMRISLRAADGLQVQPDAVYRSLRAALFAAPAPA